LPLVFDFPKLAVGVANLLPVVTGFAPDFPPFSG